MTALETILALTNEEKKVRGLLHTPWEISQQPETWLKTVEVVRAMSSDLTSLIQDILQDPAGRVILCGAGTSEFIGDACEGPLRRSLAADVDSRATTDIITNSRDVFVSERRYLVISFARSGNSPESIGTWKIVESIPGARQLAITCNPDGALARAARAGGDSLALLLPEETHDESLVMTSSFTNMLAAVIGLSRLDDLDVYEKEMAIAADAGRRILDQADSIGRFAERGWKRGVYLGSGPLKGTAREAHLKMLESTDGQVMTRFDSFLGLRHGPLVSIDDDSFVMAMLSDDPYVRRYELDLLKEIAEQGKSGGILVVTRIPDHELNDLADVVVTLQSPDGPPIREELRVLTDIIVAQLLAMFCSLERGLKPDAPNTDGTINRVVQGVKIYDRRAYEKTGAIETIAG